jgi:arylsulfatase A-like enzyme
MQRDIGVAIAVVAGWAAYDLSLLATSGHAYLVFQLLPAYAAALLLAALAGVLFASDFRIFWIVFALTTTAAVVPKVYPPDIPWHLICLPRSLFLLLVAFMLTRRISHQAHAVFCPGGALGAMAAVAFAGITGTYTAFSSVASILAFVLLATCWLERIYRRVATTGALVIAAFLVAIFAHRNAAPPRPDRDIAALQPVDKGANLVLVVLDTVSALHLAPYGYERVTTPGLDAFVRKYAIQYTQARSVSSWTLPSHASIFTGLYPSVHGADHPRHVGESGRNPGDLLDLWPAEPLRSDVTTLAERLAAAGYETGAIVANSGYLNHAFGIDRGFEHYDDREAFSLLLLPQLAGFGLDFRKGTSRTAERITDLGIQWIDARERRRPFFLFLNYMDAHAPYAPPSPYDRHFEDEQSATATQDKRKIDSLQYDRELRYLDAQVSRFLAAIEARSLLDGTVLVVTSDHGEAFGEHGFWRHDQALYGELIRVPLYVKPAGPSRPGLSDRRITGPALYRLILAELGLPAAVPDGEDDSAMIAELYQPDKKTADMVAKKDNAPVPLDRDLVTWFDRGLKWIVSSKGEVEVYDLESDPGELRPLQFSTEQAESARARARAWWKAHPPLAPDQRTSTRLDPAVVERLRALGYVK